MTSYILTILIPTYNRKKYLKNNLQQLTDIIRNNNLQKIVSIIVSDNFSSDGTKYFLNEFSNKYPDVNIKIYRHKNNIGLEKNALFVLRKAHSKYCMYLGDDDYIREEYIIKVVNLINDDENLTCVIPSIIRIDPDGELIKRYNKVIARDINKNSTKYRKGIITALKLFIKGHQLSGIVLKRDGLIESYESESFPNIYLFIYFVGFSCFHGNVYHITDYPVKVTEGERKDWGYGKDGLLDEVFKNTHMLFKNNYFARVIAELRILILHDWRYLMYFRKTPIKGISALCSIIKVKNFSFAGKLLFPFVFIFRVIYTLLKKTARIISFYLFRK